MAGRDDGFSIAEVVIAAAILFFVLTAMVGLVGASQRMSVTAKQRTAVTNAMAQYIDRLRALDYQQLALEPAGAVKSSDSVSYGAYTVNFSNRVVFPDSADGKFLKTVYITGSCTIGGRTYTTTAVVHIKNPKNDTTAASLVDPNLPQIEIVSPTPAADAVVTGKSVHPSYTSLRIAAQVHSPQDKIVEVQYKVGTVLVRDNAGSAGRDAWFTFSPGDANVSTVSEWDTTQDGVIDGFQKVVIIAKDDQGRVATEERRFIVDNVVPGVPGAPVGSTVTATQGKLDFTAAPDPVPPSGVQASTFATRYMYSLLKEPIGGGDWSTVASGTVNAGTTYAQATSNGGTITAPLATLPFSRYWATVRAGSPRDFNWTQQSEMATPFVTRPETHSDPAQQSTCLTSYTKAGANRTTDYKAIVYVSKAQFPVSSAGVTYVYQYRDAATAGAWTTFTPRGGNTAVETGDYVKLDFTFRDYTESKNLYFRIGMSCVPSGWRGGTATPVLYTNAIGITPKDLDQGSTTNSGVQPLTPDSTWAE